MEVLKFLVLLLLFGDPVLAQVPGTFCFSCAKRNAGCNLPWGGSLASGGTTTAYSTATPSGSCAAVSETRTCLNAFLSGSFSIGSCNAGCAAGSAGHCDYGANVHGASSGACAVGYTGSCSFSCQNGVRSPVSNTCAPPCVTLTACVDGSDSFQISGSTITHTHLLYNQVGTHNSCTGASAIPTGGYLIDGVPYPASSSVAVPLPILNSINIISSRGNAYMSGANTLRIDDGALAAGVYVIQLCQ